MLYTVSESLHHVQTNVFLSLFLVCDVIIYWIIIYYLFSNFKYVVKIILNKEITMWNPGITEVSYNQFQG